MARENTQVGEASTRGVPINEITTPFFLRRNIEAVRLSYGLSIKNRKSCHFRERFHYIYRAWLTIILALFPFLETSLGSALSAVNLAGHKNLLWFSLGKRTVKLLRSAYLLRMFASVLLPVLWVFRNTRFLCGMHLKYEIIMMVIIISALLLADLLKVRPNYRWSFYLVSTLLPNFSTKMRLK